MPAFIHGKKIRVLLNDGEFSQYFKEQSTSVSMDVAETSAFGSEVKTYVQGMSAGTLSLSGMYDGTAGAVDEELSQAIGATLPTVATIATTGSFAVGRRIITGQGTENSYQISGSIGDIVGISAELQGTGGFQSGISLHDLDTAESAATTSASVDTTRTSTRGAVLTLHLTENTRDGATVVKVQHSADAVTWVDLGTFASVPATTKATESLVVGTAVTINRHLRAVSTIAGTTGSVKYTVGSVRL